MPNDFTISSTFRSTISVHNSTTISSPAVCVQRPFSRNEDLYSSATATRDRSPLRKSSSNLKTRQVNLASQDDCTGSLFNDATIKDININQQLHQSRPIFESDDEYPQFLGFHSNGCSGDWAISNDCYATLETRLLETLTFVTKGHVILLLPLGLIDEQP